MAQQVMRSYRESHLDTERARSYDHQFHDARTARGLDWLLEQHLMDSVLRQRGHARVGLDFACGTGRVLGFLSERFPMAIGIDISEAMLEVARERHPSAMLVHGDVTANPALYQGHADVITAFRFFLNAEPPLRSAVLHWMHDHLSADGVLIANFHLNRRSLRGRYLHVRGVRDVRSVTLDDTRQVLAQHGFRVSSTFGYSYLPYRRDGARMSLPRVRRRIEGRLVRVHALTRWASCFLVVAERSDAHGSAHGAKR